jgi:hypothetical protein
MSLNTGTFLATADPTWTRPDGLKLPPLVVPDGRGPWAVRYIWVKHQDKNEEFVSNYFNKGNNAAGTGLNLRKQTEYMQTAWNPHNQIFETSRDNGNLVWRVKVHNPLANSIDYVEVWRSQEILQSLFDPIADNSQVQVNETTVRTADNQRDLRTGLYNAGFEVRGMRGRVARWPAVSKLTAMGWYKHFVQKFHAKDNCIINTPYNVELNPFR